MEEEKKDETEDKVLPKIEVEDTSNSGDKLSEKSLKGSCLSLDKGEINQIQSNPLTPLKIKPSSISNNVVEKLSTPSLQRKKSHMYNLNSAKQSQLDKSDHGNSRLSSPSKMSSKNMT